jgi:hypothetical protein
VAALVTSMSVIALVRLNPAERPRAQSRSADRLRAGEERVVRRKLLTHDQDLVPLTG